MLGEQLEKLFHQNQRLKSKLLQLGSIGGGNHFLSADVADAIAGEEVRAGIFGVKPGCVGALTHCGSRGFGYNLAEAHFKNLREKFTKWKIPFPANDHHLVYAPLGTEEANNYLADMSLGGNFATVNHLLLNVLTLEAFQEIIPGTKGKLVYYISHNIAREEIVDNQKTWVSRKGSTRAFPAGHHDLKETPLYATGHPILLPGNPESGSFIMAAEPGAVKTAYSINHGAGRSMGRNASKKALNQKEVNEQMDKADILSNCRNYPVDESKASYKDFDEVTKSVEEAGLAKSIARLRTRFVIKDGDQSKEGSA